MIEKKEPTAIYAKGRREGEQAVLRLIKLVLDNAGNSGYQHSPSYYRVSLNFILELYKYGTEKETKEECTKQET